MPNFVYVVSSAAELAHGEKSCTQSLTQSLVFLFFLVTHLAYLIYREPKLIASENKYVLRKFSATKLLLRQSMRAFVVMV